MNRIIYGFTFLLLVIQIKGQLDQEEAKKIFTKCLDKEMPADKCEDIFEAVFGKRDAIYQKVKQYKLFAAEVASNYSLCLASKRLELECGNERAEREKEMSQTKQALYPWLDMYEICDRQKTDIYCENIIHFFHFPDNWHKKPETLIAELKMVIEVTAKLAKEMKEDGGKQKLVLTNKSFARGLEL